MKKALLVSSLFVATALVSQSALAEVKIRAGVASSTYSLSGDYITAKSTYSPTNFGLTFAADNGFYVDLALSNGTGKHDGWAYLDPAGAEQEFKREDAALIFGGSSLNPNTGIAGTVYIGVKTGTTTLGNEKLYQLGWTRISEKFETSGLVFGGGASFPIASGKAGMVGINLGLGLMSGKWSTTGDNRSAKANSTLGFSLGASYTFPFSSNFGVVVDGKYNNYRYNYGDTNNPFIVTEKITAVGASLYAKF